MNDQKKSWFAKHKVVTGFLIIFAIGVINAAIEDQTSSNTKPSITENKPTINKTEAPSQKNKIEAKMGEEGKLFIEGATQMYIAVDESALDEFTKAAIVNDTYGQAELVLANKVFAVNNGTKVQVIDLAGFGKKKIRVLEGEMTGKSGWVAKEFVIKD